MKVKGAAATHVGMVRKENQDSYLVEEPLYVVADGMGGHLGGEVASGTTVETFQSAAPGLLRDPNPVERLIEVTQAANRTVYVKASGDPQLNRMGTTLTAALARGGRLFIAHVGDSRCYRLRDGVLDQLTEDHTLVGEFVREGKITEEDARHHPQRSIITRALGVEPAVPVDSITLEVMAGDRFLLCSDGLYGMLYDEEILPILQDGDDLQSICDRLVEAANNAGGEDNVTVVIFDIEDADADGDEIDTSGWELLMNGGTDVDGPGVPGPRSESPIGAETVTFYPRPEDYVFGQSRPRNRAPARPPDEFTKDASTEAAASTGGGASFRETEAGSELDPDGDVAPGKGDRVDHSEERRLRTLVWVVGILLAISVVVGIVVVVLARPKPDPLPAPPTAIQEQPETSFPPSPFLDDGSTRSP